jgi:hypothetical protein
MEGRRRKFEVSQCIRQAVQSEAQARERFLRDSPRYFVTRPWSYLGFFGASSTECDPLTAFASPENLSGRIHRVNSRSERQARARQAERGRRTASEVKLGNEAVGRCERGETWAGRVCRETSRV